ncbi:hypothetical protein [Staphylococcus aureus]|uniref:hypothetical protein n=1 Tax=Staphylococcus aureus TaxID=1280 RepID=UPI0005C7BABC|nr:hypothetical protein [Staphylococcus aureus]
MILCYAVIIVYNSFFVSVYGVYGGLDYGLGRQRQMFIRDSLNIINFLFKERINKKVTKWIEKENELYNYTFNKYKAVTEHPN